MTTCLTCLAISSSISSIVGAGGVDRLGEGGVASIARRGGAIGGAAPACLAASAGAALVSSQGGAAALIAAAAALGRLVVAAALLVVARQPLVRVLGQAGGRVELAVGPDPTGEVGDLVRLDQLPADLDDQLAADGQLLGHPAIGPVVMQLQLDLDGPTALGAGQRQAVEQVDARDEVEGLGERAVADLGRDRPLAQHDRGRVAVETVGQQQAAFDLEDRDRRQPIPGVGVSLDREIVQPVAEIRDWDRGRGRLMAPRGYSWRRFFRGRRDRAARGMFPSPILLAL